MTVGPVGIGTLPVSVLNSDDYAYLGSQLQASLDTTGKMSLDLGVYDADAGMEVYLSAERVDATPGSGHGQVGLYGAASLIDLHARDTGETNLTIKGNSGQTGPEIIVKDSAGVAQIQIGTLVPSFGSAPQVAVTNDSLNFAVIGGGTSGGLTQYFCQAEAMDAGDGTFAYADVAARVNPGIADSGRASLAASTNNSEITASAGDSTDTFLKMASTVAGKSTFIDLKETVAAPAAPAADYGRIFMRDNGSGKTQFCVRFPSGAVQVLATEP
jgi:hypothetical protein